MKEKFLWLPKKKAFTLFEGMSKDGARNKEEC